MTGPEVFASPALIPACGVWPTAQTRPALPATLLLPDDPALNYHSGRTTQLGLVTLASAVALVEYPAL